MERSSEGLLIPDKLRFPSGMKALGDYVSEKSEKQWQSFMHELLHVYKQIHSNGLKFGIYEDYGTKTCGGYPGIIGYEALDANIFADWGVDYVKLDGCYSDVNTMDEGDF